MTEEKRLKAVRVKTAEELKKERMMNNLLDDMELFIPYLDDRSVSDLSVQDSGELVVTRFGKGREFTGVAVPEYIAERIIKATAAIQGKSLDSFTGFPLLEGNIPRYNARITGLLPPKVIRPEIQIRIPSRTVYSLEEYVGAGQMTEAQFEQVVACIARRENIIVSGSTGSGKTTMTNAIIKKMVELTPDDNFYIIEDTPELQCSARMKSMLWIAEDEAQKAINRAAMRWTPDRIIFGEVRDGKVMRVLLNAWKRGHSGNVTTLHAEDGLSTALVIKEMLGADGGFMADHLSRVVNLVVHLRKTRDGILVDELYPVTEDTDRFITGMIQQNLA